MSQMQSLWSSATLPKRDSWSRCQATSSTTAVCPVNTFLALITWWRKVWQNVRAVIFHLICFNSSIDVPEAECLIIACGEKMSVHVWVPREAIPVYSKILCCSISYRILPFLTWIAPSNIHPLIH